MSEWRADPWWINACRGVVVVMIVASLLVTPSTAWKIVLSVIWLAGVVTLIWWARRKRSDGNIA